MNFDFIQYIINIWREEYIKSRSTDYITSDKDKKATGKILAKCKKRHPDKDSEDMCDILRVYFRDALQLQANWYKENMSLSLINSKVNEINQQVMELRRVRKLQYEDLEVKKDLEKMEKLYGKEIGEIWSPKKTKKAKEYKNPRMKKVDFLRQVGYARMNEWDNYKNNME